MDSPEEKKDLPAPNTTPPIPPAAPTLPVPASTPAPAATPAPSVNPEIAAASQKPGVNLDNILLPKKEVHAPDSAQRVSAGILLEQEQKAATEGLEKPKAPEQLQPQPKKEESIVKPLETYQGDLESVVQTQKVSVVSIAAAEAQKRAEAAKVAVPASFQGERTPLVRRIFFIAGGVILFSGAAGLLAYFLTRPTTVPVVPLQTEAPFINVDDTTQIPVSAGVSRSTLMNALDQARKNVHLSLGLIERLQLTTPGTDAQGNPILNEFPITTTLSTLAPYIPGSLLRTITPRYLLGVHSFDENDAFLILNVDSYETAYAGMLQWENTMQADLSPLFNRTPPVHAGAAATTTVQTSTEGSSTPQGYFATTTTATDTIPSVPLPPAFVDRVVQNHDARVIQNDAGDILLLWTFLDRNTIVITNNEFTLKEIISRINQPAIQALPQ